MNIIIAILAVWATVVVWLLAVCRRGALCRELGDDAARRRFGLW